MTRVATVEVKLLEQDILDACAKYAVDNILGKGSGARPFIETTADSATVRVLVEIPYEGRM
jgi:hypothetical protein